MSESRSDLIVVVMLPVASLRANGWNPNKMAGEEFASFAETVKASGMIPKPVVVCRTGDDTYLVIDGEHALRAAEQAGLAEVPCQVLDLDPFHQRLQTHLRNIHGQAHPVLRGRMFEEMMTLRQLSNRELAKELGVSEGTVRNSRAYAQAAEVRHRHAAALGRSEQQTIDEIGRLPVEAVRVYLEMPDDARDAWLDAGCAEEPVKTEAAGSGPLGGTKKSGPKPKRRNRSWSRKARETRSSLRRGDNRQPPTSQTAEAAATASGTSQAEPSVIEEAALSLGGHHVRETADVDPHRTNAPELGSDCGKQAEPLAAVLNELDRLIPRAGIDDIRRLVLHLLMWPDVTRVIEAELARRDGERPECEATPDHKEAA